MKCGPFGPGWQVMRAVLPCLVFLAAVARTPAAPALVQENYATPQSPESQVSVTFTGAQTPGDLDVLAIGWNDASGSITSVADSLGNVYQLAVPTYGFANSGGQFSQAIYYAPNIKAGANTVTVTFNESAPYVDLRAAEYSGVSAFAGAGNSGGGNSTAPDSGPITVGTPNELLVGAGVTETGWTTGGSGWTDVLITQPDTDIFEDQVAGAPGAYDATGPLSSPGEWVMQIAAFNAQALILAITTLNVTNFVINFNSVTGQTYEVQGTTNLTIASWSPIITNILGTGGMMEVTVFNSINQNEQFYRLMVVANAPAAPATPAYPLRASANGRYLVDSNNTPFLVIGDAPHSLIVNLNSSDAASYLRNRGSNGFNNLWIELLCDGYTGGPGSEGNANYGHDIYGNNPFTSTLPGAYYDLTTPNPAYWSNADYIVRTAGTNGLQCFLTPLDQGGWTQTSLANGSNRCYAYGQFLGSRYANSPNIFWNLGNDFEDWGTATNDDVILAIAKGILSKDTNHLMTIELNYTVSQSLDDPNWQPVVSVNGVYTYAPTYAESYAAWNKTNMPALLLEANYEFENNNSALPAPAGDYVLRQQEYWSLLGGCLAGHMYGNHYTWTFTSGWQTELNTPGAVQLGYFRGFFTNLVWYSLVPDQSHRLVTAGYGTYNSTDLDIEVINYATAALSTDGTLGVVYAPRNATLTVAMTNFIGPVTARWFDPSTNAFTAIAGSPFNNTITTNLATPANNAEGDHDWVLLLEAQPPTLVPAADTNAASQFQRHYRMRSGN